MINDKNKTNTDLEHKDYWKTDPNIVSQLEQHYQLLFPVIDVAAKDIRSAIPYSSAFLNEEFDSLNNDWDFKGCQIAWLNPPFSKKELFIKQAVRQSILHQKRVFGVLPCDPSTKFFRYLVDHCEEVTLLNKRAAYINHKGDLIKGANFNSLAFLINPYHRGQANITLLDIKQ